MYTFHIRYLYYNDILAVSSSKLEKFVKQILEHFKIKQYFDEVVGATMSKKRTDKADVIEETLKRLGKINYSNNDVNNTAKEKTINTENYLFHFSKYKNGSGVNCFSAGIPFE